MFAGAPAFVARLLSTSTSRPLPRFSGTARFADIGAARQIASAPMIAARISEPKDMEVSVDIQMPHYRMWQSRRLWDDDPVGTASPWWRGGVIFRAIRVRNAAIAVPKFV